MKKKGSFLSGLVVFILIIIILGGVGYLGFNIISNSNGMAGMNMASDSTKDTSKTDTSGTGTNVTDADNTAVADANTATETKTASSTDSAYRISQINQVMLDKAALDKAYTTINTALDKMTLDPYAAADSGSSMNDQMNMGDAKNSSQTDTSSDSQTNTTVNIYTDSITDQTMQMQSMGKTYDADKMQQLHSGLYKVSVGMQLLKQLQDDVAKQIENASVDTSSKTEYYMNQYYKTIANKNKLNNAMTYINEAVELININPYVDANGLVYDTERMTTLHDSIYVIAQGVVDLNKLNDDLLTQAVGLGTLAQNAYNEAQQSQNNSMSNMNMNPTPSINLSSMITIALIAFVVIFIIGLFGSILHLFKSGKSENV